MATLTVYPDAGSGATTVDGYAYRSASPYEDWATLLAGAGNASNSTAAIGITIQVTGGTATDRFTVNVRNIFTFNTASLGATANISSAVLSVYGQSKTNGLGSIDWHICSSAPAANNAIANSDYGNLGSTSFGSIAYASISTSGYNDVTLDANGISNISKTGISKFGAKCGWDINNSFTGTWANGASSYFNAYSADQAGTSQDPKLVITYTTTSIKTVNGLAVASVKTKNGLAIASIKTINGLA